MYVSAQEKQIMHPPTFFEFSAAVFESLIFLLHDVAFPISQVTDGFKLTSPFDFHLISFSKFSYSVCQEAWLLLGHCVLQYAGQALTTHDCTAS